MGAALASHQKKADDEGWVIVWVDQSGFYLLPHHVRTWARCRQTPVLRVLLTRDHRSASGALSSDGRLFLQTQSGASHSVEVVRFLRLLLRKIAGKLLLIGDGAPIHRGHPIKDFLARGAAKRIHLEQLPGYAPDLIPISPRCLSFSEALRPPVKERGGAHEIATGLQGDTAGGLDVLQLLDRGEMAVDQDGVGERPQMFGGLQFGGIRRQEEQVDVVGHAQALGAVPARAIQDEDNLLVW